MRLFSKNVMHFEFLTNEMECERGKQDFSNKVIVLNAILKRHENGFQIYYTIGLSQLLQRQICKGNR